MNKKQLYQRIVTYLKKHHAKKIEIFGSYARHEEHSLSDIDLIVDFSDRKTLLDFAKMERELSEITGKKIDLLTKEEISPYIINYIKKDLKVLACCN